ncbi:hypothetical protein O181_016501 [Austropuccinia psidii MF-1]|uniref:Uncharacterized protein n=1 Tax=Austropuccinia psidii MF-1 TaxID=1389203 RepID=A0A9Q3GR37_9BASI|nr:hypothetical protein [Austropuccinia psidii MF-1]
MGPLGPFRLKSNEAKRSQGGNSTSLKARLVSNHKWTHLSSILVPISKIPKMAKRTPGITFRPLPMNGLWQPPEGAISGPERLPLNSGEDLSFINVPHTKGSRHGAYMCPKDETMMQPPHFLQSLHSPGALKICLQHRPQPPLCLLPPA